LYKKQKISKYGHPSQSSYTEKASAAHAIAAATHSAAAGAFGLAGGLAMGTAKFTANLGNAKPTNKSSPNSNNIEEEMYDMASPMLGQIYEDSSEYHLNYIL
jgi:hypothetical protein